MAHSPGPWEAQGKMGDIVDGSHDLLIARVSQLYSTGKANAALIAASPDLLQALDACETILSPVMADHQCFDAPMSGKRCGECMGCARFAAWTLAVAAIAKARGEAVKS